MQKLCRFEAVYMPEIQYKCHEDSPKKEYFFWRILVSQEIFAGVGSRKNLFQNSQIFQS